MFKPRKQPLQSLAAVTFLNYAARGLTLPFISLFLIEVGFTGTEIGFILSASAAVRLVVPPLLLSFADRTHTHRKLFYLLTVGNSIATAGLVGITSSIGIGATVVARDSLDMPSASLLSQLTITKLNQFGRSIYGRLRAWGSLGWAVTTLVSGNIVGAGGYGLLFVVAAIVNLLSLPFSRTLPTHTHDATEEHDPLKTAPVRRQPGFYVLMISSMLFSAIFSGVKLIRPIEA